MSSSTQALHAAAALHQAGNLAEAERRYREILAADPSLADAWNLLGLILHGRGEHAAACDHFRRAIALDPRQPTFHYHLAEARRAQGDLAGAETSARAALALNPGFALPHNTLGTVLVARGQHDAALASYRQAVALMPNFAQGHFNLGTLLQEQGQNEEAESAYRQALSLNPNYAAACARMGGLVKHLGRGDEAIALLNRAIELDPTQPEPLFNRGVLLNQRGDWQGAERDYLAATRLRADSPEVYNNLGTLYLRRGMLDEAIACFDKALEYRPDFAEVLLNLGNAFMSQGRRSEAYICYEQTLRMRPTNAQAHWNRAVARLAAGDFAAGWEEYEWRWRCPSIQPHHRQEPMWDGIPLDDRVLLVHGEQGLGDVLQFVRYLPLLAERAPNAYFEAPAALAPLLRASGYQRVIAKGDPLPAVDVQIPLMSLPRVLGTTLETIPRHVPYLVADPALVELWREKLAPLAGFRIGLAWQGSPTYPTDHFRSFPLTRYAPLALPGAQLISLQRGYGSEQVAALEGRFTVHELGEEVDREHGPFMDTAAIMRNLDLVVTSDTSTAHLAGALGVRTWVALPFAPDWRWMYDREDSPWYPTMRLFRQEKFRQWEGVFERMAEELRKVIVC